MIKILIFLSFLSNTAIARCPKPEIVFRPAASTEWTVMDEKTYQSAKNRCRVHFRKSTCLKRFFKIKYNTYYAECSVDPYQKDLQR